MIHVLRAEITKTFTLRSILATLLAAVIVPPALAFASGLAFDPQLPQAAALNVTAHGFETAGFGQPLVILLAALITGSEYLDGQIRTTLLTMPRRGRVIAAKLTVITTLAAIIGTVATGAAVLLKHATLGEHGLALHQFTTGMGWNLLGVAVNYALIAVVAASITILARTFIVTLVVLVPLVLGLTISLIGIAPALRYLPDLAGIQLLTAYPGVGLLDPIPGGLIMTAWALAFITISAAVFIARDSG